MAQQVSFEEFFAKLKTEFEKNEVAIPEDMEMLEIAHMEYIEEETPVDEFIQKMVAEVKGS